MNSYFWYWSNPAKNLRTHRLLWPCRDSLISVVSLQIYSIDHYYITSSGLCSAEYLRPHLNPYLLIRALNFRHVLKPLQNQYDLNASVTDTSVGTLAVYASTSHFSSVARNMEYLLWLMPLLNCWIWLKYCWIIFDLIHLYFYLPKRLL